MKATEQYFPVVLFIMLYKVVLTFESVNEILKCDHSNESYWAVLSRGSVCYLVLENFRSDYEYDIEYEYDFLKLDCKLSKSIYHTNFVPSSVVIFRSATANLCRSVLNSDFFLYYPIQRKRVKAYYPQKMREIRIFVNAKKEHR